MDLNMRESNQDVAEMRHREEVGLCYLAGYRLRPRSRASLHCCGEALFSLPKEGIPSVMNSVNHYWLTWVMREVTLGQRHSHSTDEVPRCLRYCGGVRRDYKVQPKGLAYASVTGTGPYWPGL